MENIKELELIKQAKRTYKKQWRDANKEHINEYMRTWRNNNKEKCKAYDKTYWLRKAKEFEIA